MLNNIKKYKKNKKEFLIRFFYGLIYVFLILFSIEKGEKFFRVIMMFLSILCFIEFLIILKTNILLIKLSSFILLFSIILDIFMSKGLYLYIICFIPYFIIFFTIQLFSIKYSNKEKYIQISNLIVGLVYIIIPFYLASYMYTKYNKGKELILGTFILIWINDTLSYLIGKKWGKRKISVSISPKKSIEGIIGGFFFSFIFGIFLYKIWIDKYWLIFSVIIPIFSTIGDLVESTIKRFCNVKNSGILFPGHGGFLDRLDSFIFVIPIIATIIETTIIIK
ncbi:phosphatidate cytidylyltransferase [Blattabacterium cuenoti]|uniref:phosphatidate cytidylyltransferase n=1 Tax=Blattabacterium cuenoti TaxID=1653831 RepID=UPI00163B926C|nr:phosphatidate cytidylyltransferase [Blattabacterium cuenoti]